MNIQHIQEAFLFQEIDLAGRIFDLEPLLGQSFKECFLITDYHSYKSLDPVERFAEMQAKARLIQKLGLRRIEITLTGSSLRRSFSKNNVDAKEEDTAVLYPSQAYEQGITLAELDVLLESLHKLYGLKFDLEASRHMLEKIHGHCQCQPVKILGDANLDDHENPYLTLLLIAEKLKDTPENRRFVEEYVAYHNTWENIYLTFNSNSLSR